MVFTEEMVATALQWSCDICQARVKHLCTNSIDPSLPLPYRPVHFGRLVDRRRK